jgi:hypothetical protein
MFIFEPDNLDSELIHIVGNYNKYWRFFLGAEVTKYNTSISNNNLSGKPFWTLAALL